MRSPLATTKSTFTLILPLILLGTDAVADNPNRTVPHGAAAAGLTTLALDSDFTQPMPNNWLGGCSAAGNGEQVNTNDNIGHTWWMNIWWSWTYQPCNTTQRQDPAYGGLVLDLPWTVDLNAEQNVGTIIQSAAWYSTGEPGTATTFPNNAYYEIEMRISPPQSFQGSWGGMFTWPLLAMTDRTKEGLEFDIIELDTWNLSNTDTAVHNWSASGSPGSFIWLGYNGLPLTFNPWTYHKFGLRTTSDGTDLSACSYIDDTFIKCLTHVPGKFTPSIANERNFLIIQNACDWWNYSTTCASRQLQHEYIKHVRVWSCQTWQTTECNGPILTGWP